MKRAKNRWLARLVSLLLLSGVLATAALAATPGSEEDPLVTLSYLNETFLPQLLSRVDQRLGDAAGNTGVNADTFAVVTLSNGQTLTGEIGCEVMLRVGAASCVSASNPGLIDETDGSVLGNGKALVQNHMYMMTIEGRGVRAGSDVTRLMVRGGYSIG